MLAGAVVAVSLQRPLLIAPLAIASHFLLDVLPHFGVHHGDTAKRNKHPLFQYIITIDILLTVALLIMLPSILQGAVTWWVLLLGMIFAYLPDLTWVHHFFYELWYKRKKLHIGRLSRFHDKIQWGERSWGVAVELVWFGSMGVLLGVLGS
jgi:hypothetical protein